MPYTPTYLVCYSLNPDLEHGAYDIATSWAKVAPRGLKQLHYLRKVLESTPYFETHRIRIYYDDVSSRRPNQGL
jgi:hypothetical protein